jgi:predicted nucleic acid-binding protein
MKRVLLDVNVVLDVLLDRRPFVESASEVWAAVERGEADGLISAHAVTTLQNLNARAVGPSMASQTTDALLSVFDVAPVDGAVLKAAASAAGKDFEDAVTAAAAHRAGCDAIVTRNPRDFARARVRVLTSPEAAAWLNVSTHAASSARP